MKKEDYRYLLTGIFIGILVAGMIFILFSFGFNSQDSQDDLNLTPPENPPITYSPFKEVEIPSGISVIDTTYERTNDTVYLYGKLVNNGKERYPGLQITYFVFNSTGVFLGESSTTIEKVDAGKETEFTVLWPNLEAEIFQLDTIR